MIHLTVTVDNTAELLDAEAYDAGALLRWESSAALAGTYVEGGTEALVSGTSQYDVWDDAGTAATFYRTRISNAGGTTFSAYSAARAPVPSLVSVADAQARAGDAVTQDMIDEEEAWLASRIGPLTGERMETFYQPWRYLGEINGAYLSRRTDAVDTFTTDGDTLTVSTDWRLLDGYLIERVETGAAWLYPLVATYTPNDEELVKSVIYDLLSYRQVLVGTQSIRVGQYSETYFPNRATGVHTALLAKVNPGAGLGAYGLPFRYRRHSLDRTLVQVTS